MSTDASSPPEKPATPNHAMYKDEDQLLPAKSDTVWMLSITV